MGFISDLRFAFGLTEEAKKGINREINLYEAVESHLAWKLRLSKYLQGRSTEVLEPHTICVDNRCVLGKWIHGAGKARFGEDPLFQELTKEHAKFHFYAAKVVEAHQNGDSLVAKKILTEDFAKQSQRTVSIISKLHMGISSAGN